MKKAILALLAALQVFAKDRAEELRAGLDGLAEADLPKRFDQVVDAFQECSSGKYVAVNASGAQDPALWARIHAALAEVKDALKESVTAKDTLTKANEALQKAEQIQFANMLNGKLIEAKHDLSTSRWAKAVDFTTTRAGFLMCNDLEVTARLIQAEPMVVGMAEPAEKMRDLVEWMLSDEYFVLREQLGLQVG